MTGRYLHRPTVDTHRCDPPDADFPEVGARPPSSRAPLVAEGGAVIVDERLRARRKVTESDGMWTVTDSEFATTDQALARAVAAELDRVEPLDRAITSSEAVTRAREILNEMDEMLDAARPDHDRFDVLRRELDVLQEHVRRLHESWKAARDALLGDVVASAGPQVERGHYSLTQFNYNGYPQRGTIRMEDTR